MVLHDARRQDVEQHVGTLDGLFAVAVAKAPRVVRVATPLEAQLVRGHVFPAEAGARRAAEATGRFRRNRRIRREAIEDVGQRIAYRVHVAELREFEVEIDAHAVRCEE